MISNFSESPRTNRFFEQVKNELSALNDTQVKPFALNHLKKRSETYVQNLKSVKGGENIYSYIRSKDGYGSECLLLAAPLSYKAGLAYMMTFVELMVKE